MASADQVDRALRSALYFARAAGALRAAGETGSVVQNRLQIAASRLAQAHSYTISSTSTSVSDADYSHLSVANVAPLIGTANTFSSASMSPVLAPQSLGTISAGDAAQSPLARSGVIADLASNANALPFELAGTSVSVSGRAAPLLYVSPARISFLLPQGLTAGEAEVLVTSQDGYVSRSTVTVNAIAPAFFTADASGAGRVLTLNGEGSPTSFDVLSPHALGTDKRTRVMLFATGISGGAANRSTDNDVRTDNGGTIANLAESLMVEARTADGRIFQMPVEFAGASVGRMPGLDQVNVVLNPELRGAGLVDLTIIINGQRSNTASISVR
jgi:uncharacterized protein (TIGR03437 family)